MIDIGIVTQTPNSLEFLDVQRKFLLFLLSQNINHLAQNIQIIVNTLSVLK